MNKGAIQAKYDELGYEFSWFFMMTEEARLYDAQVALVGLNPGGGHWDPPVWAPEAGNKYLDAEPKDLSRVHRQVRALHSVMEWSRKEVFSAQFIPFRSPSFKVLREREKALEFSRELWRWVLSVSPAKKFLCMGSLAAWEVAGLISAIRDPHEYPTGWGSMKFRRFVSPDGRVVVEWPHPSRYALFGRAEGRSTIAEASIRAALTL